MWYKKVEHKNGKYADKDGKRYGIVECKQAISPKGKKNAELGLTEYKNMEECLKSWELELYIEPKKEEDIKVEEPEVEVIIPKKRLEPKKEVNLLLEKV